MMAKINKKERKRKENDSQKLQAYILPDWQPHYKVSLLSLILLSQSWDWVSWDWPRTSAHLLTSQCDQEDRMCRLARPHHLNPSTWGLVLKPKHVDEIRGDVGPQRRKEGADAGQENTTKSHHGKPLCPQITLRKVLLDTGCPMVAPTWSGF